MSLALFVDLNGDGDFCDPGEELYNAFDDNGSTGVSFTDIIGNGSVQGGETVRIVVSDSPISCDQLPECGEVEDYILCDPCPDEPYIEPFWQECPSNNVCELESWPIHVLDGNGDPLLIIDGYSFLWSDNSTSDVLYGVVAWQEYWVEVTYPNGCVYTLYYYKECCEGEVSVIFDECPGAQMEVLLEEDIVNHDPERSVPTLEDKENALRAYQNGDRGLGEDCDPCVGGIVVITVVDGDGIELTNYETISITDNNTHITTQVNQTQFTVYVDTPYTITVVVVDANGNTCEYTHDFIYECCGALSAPTNLQISGATLSWDPVPGATGYVVESTNFWPIECSCTNPISILPIQTTQTSVQLPVGADRCFVVQVRAICADGTQSNPSDWICVGGSGHGKGMEVLIVPNPNNGEMVFNLHTQDDTKVSIEVYDFQGTLIEAFDTQSFSNEATTLSWDGTHLRKGMYFVKFISENQQIIKKLIIQ
ncbi:MAG: T9SS type A sorting domain-containing protein [Flavobacteriaceae bacterium]